MSEALICGLCGAELTGSISTVIGCGPNGCRIMATCDKCQPRTRHTRLGDFLRTRRLGEPYTSLRDAAKGISISPKALSDYETGRATPLLSTVRILLKFYAGRKP